MAETQTDPKAPTLDQSIQMETLRALQAMSAKADTRPVYPDPDAFKATKDTYVIGNDGEKYRHGLRPEGDATLLDNKLRPVDA